jgi:SAM-dependent methyltransferase
LKPARLLLPLAVLLQIAGAQADGDRAGFLDRVREIQVVCFATYPADLVARMSGREGPIPDAVRSDPRLQVKYLKTEEVVAKGLFYPSLLDELLPAFEATVRPGARFLDLGSGDGRVVFLAALLGAHATGIEYDRRLHRIALEARRRLEEIVPTDRALLHRSDFFRADLAAYDVLFYFGSGSYAEDRMLAKLGREMREDAVLLLAHGPPAVLPGLTLIASYGPVQAYRRGRA